MNELTLRRPTLADEGAAAEFIREFADAGERLIPGGSGIQTLLYAEWLKKIDSYSQGLSLQEGHVPADTYFTVRISDGRIIGVVDIRHRLTEYLTHIGGNIGYSIRPSERRKGYGAMQLKLALERCAELGIDPALVTCDDDNPASANTALSQGGVETDSYTDEDDMVQRRFFVPTGRK